MPERVHLPVKNFSSSCRAKAENFQPFPARMCFAQPKLSDRMIPRRVAPAPTTPTCGFHQYPSSRDARAAKPSKAIQQDRQEEGLADARRDCPCPSWQGHSVSNSEDFVSAADLTAPTLDEVESTILEQAARTAGVGTNPAALVEDSRVPGRVSLRAARGCLPIHRPDCKKVFRAAVTTLLAKTRSTSMLLS